MRRDPQVLAAGGRLVVTLTVLVALLPAAAAPTAAAPAAQAGAGQPSSGPGNDRLRAEALRALDRWDAQQVTIEDAAEQINAVTQQVGALQARITALEQVRRAVGTELVGADGAAGQDPVAGVRSLAARFFNSFATGLSGALGGSGDRRDYGPVLFELPASIDERQRRTSQLDAQRRTLSVLYQRLEEDQDRTPEEVRRLADKLAKERERRRQAAYKQWAAGVRDQYGTLHSGPLQPAQAAVAALTFALNQQGKAYVWGATGPSTYDCSGLTLTAYRQAGVAIPRVSRDQARFGEQVAFNNLAPGDLVFFGNPVHHVAMYYRAGLMVHAPHTGDVVRLASVFRRGYAGARRPVAAVGGTGSDVPLLPPPSAMVLPEHRAPGPGTGTGGTSPRTTETSATTGSTATTVAVPSSTGTTVTSGPTVSGSLPETTTTTEPPVTPTPTPTSETPSTSSDASEPSGQAPPSDPATSARAPP
jgi:cell wall-associated NlpC family hydrolase